MKFHQRKLLIENEFQLAEFNGYNPNYITYPFEKVDMKKVEADFILLKKFEKAHIEHYHTSSIPIEGDCIFLPDGQVVYFCSIISQTGQTCESGSFALYNSGHVSFSAGGLDPGILISDVYLTNEYYVLPIWFCHEGRLNGGCGINANIRCRVWKPKEGADLSGIPQVQRLRKQKLKEQGETIIKFDAFGKSYKEPDGLIESIAEDTGLVFEHSYRYFSIYWCQPMKLIQVDMIRSLKQFTFKEEYDFFSNEPVLKLSIKKDYKP